MESLKSRITLEVDSTDHQHNKAVPVHRNLLPWLAGLFVLLSVVDLLLTFWLLETKGGRVYEANPVANRILQTSGWPGLLAFKGTCVLFAVITVSILAQSRPVIAHRLLGAGCLTLLMTVLLGGTLGVVISPSSQPPGRDQPGSDHPTVSPASSTRAPLPRIEPAPVPTQREAWPGHFPKSENLPGAPGVRLDRLLPVND